MSSISRVVSQVFNNFILILNQWGYYGGLSIIAALSLPKIYRFYSESRLRQQYTNLCIEKRRKRDEVLLDSQPNMEIPQEKENLILNSPVVKLIEYLNDGKITSEEILQCFQKRVIVIGKELELIGESTYKEALLEARRCDEVRRNTKDKSKLGLLFGIPISVKDCIDQKGYDSTCGSAKRINKVLQEDGLVLHLLRKQGAIPFIRGNVPQALFINESVNNIWGRAKNPWDKTRTVGGSSGGDAGLVAARCSPLAIGSDIGGSIRIPALYCGVYGFKPTTKRISLQGHTIPTDVQYAGNISIITCVGPIGKCVDDLILFMKCFFDEDMWSRDPYIPRQIWNNEIFQEKKQYTIGYVTNEEFFGVSKANRRAVEEAAEAYRKAGMNVVKVTLPNFEELSYTYMELTTAEGGMKRLFDSTSGEKLIDEYKTLVQYSKIPKWVRSIISPILSLLGEKRAAKIIKNTYGRTCSEYFNLNRKMFKNQEIMLKFWNTQQLDALITPGLATPAIPHTLSQKLMISCCYTYIFNLLNYPTGAVPITKVRPGEDNYTNSDCIYKGDVFFKKAQQALAGTQGLPVGVQISTLPFEDEKCLKIMKILEDNIKFNEYAL